MQYKDKGALAANMRKELLILSIKIDRLSLACFLHTNSVIPVEKNHHKQVACCTVLKAYKLGHTKD
ncbi:hypothetical protein CWC00_15540 [Pseudoalteromonas rubra]|nr:hypothetical protein CWC00_15540 [Pseudoalteromonas rubra]